MEIGLCALKEVMKKKKNSTLSKESINILSHPLYRE